jgi:hypothetical protein
MMEPKLEVIPAYGSTNACEFTKDGICIGHRTHISEHSMIGTSQTMTREEAKRRFPELAARIDALP